jgi:hypothetical protein
MHGLRFLSKFVLLGIVEMMNFWATIFEKKSFGWVTIYSFAAAVGSKTLDIHIFILLPLEIVFQVRKKFSVN